MPDVKVKVDKLDILRLIYKVVILYKVIISGQPVDWLGRDFLVLKYNH